MRASIDGDRGYGVSLRWHASVARIEELAHRWSDVVGMIEIVAADRGSWHFGPQEGEPPDPPTFVAVTKDGRMYVGSGLTVIDGDAWLVDSRFGRPLHDLYSGVTESGRKGQVLELVRSVVEDLQALDVLTDRGDPRLHLTFSRSSVPVAMAGDGIQVLVRLCLEFAARSGGTLLLEEPEAHQHPAAIRQSARAIVAGVRTGVQAVVATHSLELIDALVAELRDDELDALSLYRLRLAQGELRSIRLGGREVRAARHDIEEDLR